MNVNSASTSKQLRKRVNESTTHILDINSYSISELYGLFNIPPYEISGEQLKSAKKQVLMLHPDKSGLPSDYFLFYKKAYECLTNFYAEQQKITADPTTALKKIGLNYDTSSKTDEYSEYIHAKINSMNKKEFTKTFNTVFEKEMAVKPDPLINKWFEEETPLYDETLYKPTGESGINKTIEKIRKNINGIVVYKGVQPLTSSSTNACGGLYDEPDETSYVTSDPFSKLKYDDLRKVHKDQTVLTVSEDDFSNVKQYKNVKDYSNARNSQQFNYASEAQSLRILEEKEKIHKDLILKKQFESDKRSLAYVAKNSSVMSSFLRLT